MRRAFWFRALVLVVATVFGHVGIGLSSADAGNGGPCDSKGYPNDLRTEGWFERVRCEIPHLTSEGRGLGLVELVVRDGRRISLRDLEPDSPPKGVQFMGIGKALYGVHVEREYWKSAPGPVDSLLSRVIVYKRTPTSKRTIAISGAGTSPTDLFVRPGDRVLGFIERVPYLLGGVELWQLRKALVLRPEGASMVTDVQFAEQNRENRASSNPPFGLGPNDLRTFSEPLDRDRTPELIEATVLDLEAAAARLRTQSVDVD